jgi:hypothetical protein
MKKFLLIGCLTLNVVAFAQESLVMQHMPALEYCPGQHENIGFEATGTYNFGNLYIPQLSDANGSFANPVNLGAFFSTATGIQTVMACTIPANTPAGTGYRVRMTSTNPVVIGTDSGEDITILPVPTIDIMTEPADGIICEGENVTIYAGGATTYSWTPSETLDDPYAATVVATPTSAGTWTYTVTGTEGCTTSRNVDITVMAVPTISIATDPVDGVICEGHSATLTASGATTYIWTPSGTLNNANAATVTATPLTTTTYTVTESDCNASATVEITVQDCAGIEENNAIDVKLYPNPASDALHVTAGAIVSKAELLDQSGRIIRTVVVNNTDFDLNISDLNQGVYFVRIDGNTTSRFTKR